MPLPAGTGLDRRSFLARSVGLAIAVYGATALAPRALDHGIAQALAAGPLGHGARLGLPRRRRRLALAPLPARRPRLPQAAPEARARPTRGSSSRRTRACAGIPPRPRFHTLHGEGKLAVLPAVGYTNADQSHFTSRHYWEVGDTDPRLQTGWLGRYLDRVGKADNPLQGVSLDGELSPVARDREEARRRAERRRATTRSGRRASGARSRTGCSSAVGSLGASRGHDTALAGAREVTFQSHRLRQQLAPFERRIHSPGPVPEVGQRLPGPAGRARRDARRRPAAPLRRAERVRRCTTRIRTRRRTSPTASSSTSDTLLAFQRDLEARGLAEPRADARLVGVRPPRRGERLRRHRPRRRRDRPADGHARARDDDRRVPGPRGRARRGRQPQGDRRLPERSTSSVLEQWLSTDAAAVIPHAKSFARVPLLR